MIRKADLVHRRPSIKRAHARGDQRARLNPARGDTVAHSLLETNFGGQFQ